MTSRGRPVRGLDGQARWNRTLGIGTLLRELEKQFAVSPPRKMRGGDPGLSLKRMLESLRGFLRRVLGRRHVVAAAAVAAPDVPEAIRARYDEIIRDRTSRLERYKEAVAQLMSQWQQKRDGLEELGREIQNLERVEEDHLAETERLVARLKSEGRGLEQIKADAAYRHALAAYEDLATDLDDKQERFADLERDAEVHLAKIREHETRLEALVRELEEIEDESAEVAADLATVQLEAEIADLRAGITRAGSDQELRKLLRQFRKAKASVRITREAADLDVESRDAEYLEVARKVEAARRFEASVGLGEADLSGEPERE